MSPQPVFIYWLLISIYVQNELAKEWIAGSFSTPLLPSLHVSPSVVIPKKHHPGKWYLILDLSSPEGHSVNDGIGKEPSSVQCVTVDDIVDGIMSFRRSVLLVKRYFGFERFEGPRNFYLACGHL